MTSAPTLTIADRSALERAQELIGWYEEPDQPLGDREDETFRHLLKYHLSGEDEARFADLRQRFAGATSPPEQVPIARQLCAWFDDLTAGLTLGSEHERFVDADCGGYPGEGPDTLCPRSPVDMAEPIPV